MDALSQARRVLTERMSDPKAKMFGLSSDLAVILRAFEELERRIGVLAVIALRKHYRPDQPMHKALWQSLSEMSDHARIEYRIGEHDPRCVCEDCCIHRLIESRRS